jgi:integrase
MGKSAPKRAVKGAFTPGLSTHLEASPVKATDGGSCIEEERSCEGLELPKILTYEEIDRFLVRLQELEDLIAARLMLFVGLRIFEVVGVRRGDLNVKAGAVFVRQGKGCKDR